MYPYPLRAFFGTIPKAKGGWGGDDLGDLNVTNKLPSLIDRCNQYTFCTFSLIHMMHKYILYFVGT
jgi:hypothetical protein